MFDIRYGDNGEIVLDGRLDASQTAKARAFLEEVNESHVVDCSSLEYISSAGLGILLMTQKKLQASSGGLDLINVNNHIYDVFHYSGLDRVFKIKRTEN
jgi:anti-sigma B factor antagonist